MNNLYIYFNEINKNIIKLLEEINTQYLILKPFYKEYNKNNNKYSIYINTIKVINDKYYLLKKEINFQNNMNLNESQDKIMKNNKINLLKFELKYKKDFNNFILKQNTNATNNYLISEGDNSCNIKNDTLKRFTKCDTNYYNIVINLNNEIVISLYNFFKLINSFDDILRSKNKVNITIINKNNNNINISTKNNIKSKYTIIIISLLLTLILTIAVIIFILNK